MPRGGRNLYITLYNFSLFVFFLISPPFFLFVFIYDSLWRIRWSRTTKPYFIDFIKSGHVLQPCGFHLEKEFD